MKSNIDKFIQLTERCQHFQEKFTDVGLLKKILLLASPCYMLPLIQEGYLKSFKTIKEKVDFLLNKRFLIIPSDIFYVASIILVKISKKLHFLNSKIMSDNFDPVEMFYYSNIH